MQIDRKKYFDGYRRAFGPLNQSLVTASEALIEAMEDSPPQWADASSRTYTRRLAYMLATFKWETAHTMKPIDEYGSPSYFEGRYGHTTRVGKILGNTQPGDGSRFHGRGFVQITGRTNYERASVVTGVDLIDNPEQAKSPDFAWLIATDGMSDGWFTGKKLADYIHDKRSSVDYVNARRIINGLDKAERIADIAVGFDNILTGCVKW